MESPPFVLDAETDKLAWSDLGVGVQIHGREDTIARFQEKPSACRHRVLGIYRHIHNDLTDHAHIDHGAPRAILQIEHHTDTRVYRGGENGADFRENEIGITGF